MILLLHFDVFDFGFLDPGKVFDVFASGIQILDLGKAFGMRESLRLLLSKLSETKKKSFLLDFSDWIVWYSLENMFCIFILKDCILHIYLTENEKPVKGINCNQSFRVIYCNFPLKSVVLSSVVPSCCSLSIYGIY